MNADVKKKIGSALWSAFITPNNDTELRDMVYGANECFSLNWTDDDMATDQQIAYWTENAK